MPRDKAASLDRALEAMCALLEQQNAADISIADVAAMANCSTATLYQAFTSKEELVRAAMDRSRAGWPAPVPMLQEEGAAILRLATYLYQRASYLGSSRSVTHNRANLRRSADEKHAVAETLLDNDPLFRLGQLVEEAMDSGDLRQGDHRATAYCLKAAASFKPAIWGMMLDQQIASAEMIRDILDPFVTPQGRKALIELGASIEDQDQDQ